MVQAYCVKCRAKTDIKDPKEVKLKNGRPAVKGTCPTCGTNVFRIGAMPKEQRTLVYSIPLFQKQYREYSPRFFMTKSDYEKLLKRIEGKLGDSTEKSSTRIELPDGSKTFGKTINNDPTKYFTDEILQQLDDVCSKEFKYGETDKDTETSQDD